jgi:hypothetical protein
MYRVFFIFLISPVFLCAQTVNKENVWGRFKFFEGKWEGTGAGQPGHSTVHREYQFVLHGKFLHVKNSSVYEPQEKNPTGETHEDVGFLSYDRARKTFILRQFHGEGFVNQYVLDSMTVDGAAMSFVTESIENIPAGWRARETYTILNENEFIEVFELAEPGKQFEQYVRNHFRRDD